MAKRNPNVSDVPAKVWRAIPIDPELSKPGEEVRVMPDGRVLWKYTLDRRVMEWPSREAFVQAREKASRIPVYTPQTLLPPIDDFLRDIETHAKALGPRLNIPDAVLDGTVGSLKAVDGALRRIPRAERPVADLVTPLVAYVGEVYRKGSEGRWVKPPQNTRNDAPSILAGNARRSFDPYVDVVVPMFEPSKRPPLHLTVYGRLVGAGYPGAP